MTGTIQGVLEELLRSAKDERDKGDRFERLVGAYLRNDPVWADRFSDVWLWMQWPNRSGKPDTGIDLVARERETGDLTAIQCKFFSPDHTLQKQDIDSFFTASGKEPFRSRLIVSTTDNWSKHAEDALKDQQIPVTRLRFQDLDESSVDWSQFSVTAPDVLTLKGPKTLRPHQVDALWAVREGFSKGDRGKLIMACGTGKTLTSLRIAEDRVPVGGRVLFLVPSISLLAQTLREWTGDATADYHATMADDAELYRRRYAEMAAGRRSHRRPNVKDVAAIAEVAVGTASDALNGKGRVNPATRYRIRSVAEAIGYFPNATARSLKRSRNGVIGLCIRPFGGAPLQYISVSYYARFLNAAAVAALERKYALAILPPDISTELDDIALDGVIVADPPPGDPLIEELRNRSVPYVTDFGEVDDPTSLCVGNDQAQAVRSVCDHFKSQGARSVAILAADGDEDYTIRSLRGYEQWCAENKQSPRIERTNILDPVATAAAAQRLMVGPDRPDAIYTTEAPVGNYLVTAARAARLNTPEDLLLAYCAEHTMDPTLDDISMLSLHAEEIAQEAVDLLASTIEGQDPKPRHRVIGTTLHIRSSSLRQGVPPGSA